MGRGLTEGHGNEEEHGWDEEEDDHIRGDVAAIVAARIALAEVLSVSGAIAKLASWSSVAITTIAITISASIIPSTTWGPVPNPLAAPCFERGR